MKNSPVRALGLLAFSIVLVFLLSVGTRSPARMPGGGSFILWAIVPLCLYFPLVWAVSRMIRNPEAYRMATLAGEIGGAAQVVHMTLEAFGSHLGDRAWVTLSFMALSFCVWAAAAFRTARLGARAREAVLVAAFSAMLTMTVAVAYGLSLAASGHPDASYVATWEEFRRSGWSDAAIFNVASSFEAVASHFVVGPIVGAIVGGFGVLLAFPFRKSGKPER